MWVTHLVCNVLHFETTSLLIDLQNWTVIWSFLSQSHVILFRLPLQVSFDVRHIYMPVMALVHFNGAFFFLCQPEDMACLWRIVFGPVWSMCCRLCANHYNQKVKSPLPPSCVKLYNLKLWLISKENFILFLSRSVCVIVLYFLVTDVLFLKVQFVGCRRIYWQKLVIIFRLVFLLVHNHLKLRNCHCYFTLEWFYMYRGSRSSSTVSTMSDTVFRSVGWTNRTPALERTFVCL